MREPGVRCANSPLGARTRRYVHELGVRCANSPFLLFSDIVSVVGFDPAGWMMAKFSRMRILKEMRKCGGRLAGRTPPVPKRRMVRFLRRATETAQRERRGVTEGTAGRPTTSAVRSPGGREGPGGCRPVSHSPGFAVCAGGSPRPVGDGGWQVPACTVAPKFHLQSGTEGGRSHPPHEGRQASGQPRRQAAGDVQGHIA